MVRKKYVDYLKGIGIILVVLGHTNFCNGLVKEWIYAFHMPLFFFAAGLTIKKRETISWKISAEYLVKRVKSLLVPYFLWGLIYAGYSHQNMISLLYGSYRSISGSGSLSSLWFFPAMFLAVCGMELVRLLDAKFRLGRIGHIFIMGLCLLVSLAMTNLKAEYPLCLNVAIMALAYMIFGFLWESAASGSMGRTRNAWWALLGIISFLGTLTYQWNPIVQKSYVLMANMRIGHPIAFLFTSLMGCLLVYAMAILLDKHSKETKILSFLGKNTLVILAVHKPIIDIVARAFAFIPLPDIIELLMMGTIVLAISAVMCVIIDRFAPCLAGKALQKVS